MVLLKENDDNYIYWILYRETKIILSALLSTNNNDVDKDTMRKRIKT